jgi:hypothetical protein
MARDDTQLERINRRKKQTLGDDGDQKRWPEHLHQ